MKAFISPFHDHHWTGNALVRGRLQLHHDAQGRGAQVEAALKDLELQCHYVEPGSVDMPELNRVHAEDYLHYLRTASEEWLQRPDVSFEVRPNIWPNRYFPVMKGSLPVAKAGRYLGDGASPIVADTWKNAHSGAETAVMGAQALLDGERSVYVLSRPSGHHAMTDMAMGGSFIANAALAAERLRSTFKRVVVLDIDVHHGNGTQQLFYSRDDVLTISIHGDPDVIFPFICGYDDEVGVDAGEGYNLNIPIIAGSEMAQYRPHFERALQRISDFQPEALIIAAGYDTFRGDPFGNLCLDTPDYSILGARLAALKLPTLFVQEGGYVISALRANTRSLLEGYLGER
ncbi:histone deacetylase family protein [Paenalcaligenes niemegkensis]|uniref:histone deacetylase family protein n=1 Tax=Paenalcaligenes niemegkensis TaxID=2895469 RepID=UPI001EE9451A|nr:histone deacetylase family protein [Paenalcaligenes niemegkensis]MCQ9618149.1 histone deacetylase family protein [Paenalcaligenes niemegkensis]